MNNIDRRRFFIGAAAVSVLPAQASAQQNQTEKFDQLDAEANYAIHYMLTNVPSAKDLVELSAGYLIIPVVTQASLFFGVAVGEGVLRINGKTVDFYSSFQANLGIQISARQYSQAVFFLNQNALDRFRQSLGWRFGAGMRYVVVEDSLAASIDSLSNTADVVGLVFADSGLHVGMSIEGTKFAPIQRQSV